MQFMGSSELWIGAAVLVLLVISVFVLRERWMGRCLLLAAAAAAAGWLYFVVHPVWVESQLKHKTALLQPYLEQRYPDEAWSVATTPYREEGYQHLNPYYIRVVFETEPEACTSTGWKMTTAFVRPATP